MLIFTVSGVGNSKLHGITTLKRNSHFAAPRDVETTTNHRWASFEDTTRDKQLLLNYSIVHRVVLPGPVPGFKC